MKGKMKKIISLGIIFTLVFMLTLPVLASEKIEDVSQSHWAYQSVKKLVEKGFISLYEDNTFKGEREVTRYQLAEVVAKILLAIDQGKVKASEEDVSTLRNLSTEFRSELVELNKKTGIFSDRLEKLEEKMEVTEEDMVANSGKIMKVQKQVNKIIEDINKLEKFFNSDINARLNRVESKSRNLEERVNALEDRLSQANNKNEELKSKLNDQLLIGGGLLVLILAAG
jgi:chromosome segregation ATPase